MNKSKWLKKIMDMIVRISDLYGFDLLINEDFLKHNKEYTFKRRNDSLELIARCNKTESLSIELEDYLLAINKGLGFKKYEIKRSPLSLEYFVDERMLGSILNKDNFLELWINLDLAIELIKNENRSLEPKPFYHLYMISTNDSMNEALKAINVCRLGGLKAEIDVNPTNLEDAISHACEQNSMFICTYDGDNLEILNTNTNEETQININEIYPYVYAYVKSLSKCNGCKEKEE